jgi:uncharacterized membrane protein YgdD (TMEM256/DUF423 family)
MNIQLLITAIIGLSSVLLGSFAEHSLRETVSDEMIRKFMTGIRYHQNYSIILLFLSALRYMNLPTKLLFKFKAAFWIFLFATITFCGSVYLFVISNLKVVSYIAPVGGISLMIAWLYLAYIALSKN